MGYGDQPREQVWRHAEERVSGEQDIVSFVLVGGGDFGAFFALVDDVDGVLGCGWLCSLKEGKGASFQ